ncbi:hypothetical protein [Brumimicrobium aurantiacum]|uniref:hypothetical protein n=1 Tax=Brumimicrobium aurantiacum TaxID=1737063 RepID=UPI00196B08BC|nr:hypothetical protein [Brumimicrobium aurantiacum]
MLFNYFSNMKQELKSLRTKQLILDSEFIHRPGKQLYPLAALPEMNEPNLKEITDKLIDLK